MGSYLRSINLDAWLAIGLAWLFGNVRKYGDDRVPSHNRQREILLGAQKNRAQDMSPYENIILKTRGELSWVLAHEGWSGDNDDLPRPQLRGVILRDVILDFMQLVGADLRDADLHGVSLYKANLIGANLTRAELSEACLQGILGTCAFFMATNLRATSFLEADLEFASFNSAICDGTDFRHARFDQTSFDFAILKDTEFATWQQEHISHAKLSFTREGYRDRAA